MRCGLGVQLPGWLRGDCWGLRPKAFSCQPLLFHEEENQWIGFEAQETTSKLAGPREPEAAQAHFVFWRAEGIGEKKASVALLSKGALALGFVPRGESNVPECRSLNGV